MIRSKRSYIRVCEPDIGPREIQYVTQATKEGEISSAAKYVGLFEKAFAKRMRTRYAIAVNSGGSALFLALSALGIHPGDEVIVPTFTMIATANAVTQCGARPVFVDCEDNGNIDVAKIEDKITKKTKAIIPVHIYGHPVDMNGVMRIARRHNLVVVEDAAEAHGAMYKGRAVGSIGKVGCFSFYVNKLMTTGEGGMIVTNDKKLAWRLGKLRGYFFSDKKHFWHQELAWNMRMSALEAALGLAQLERLGELIAKRRANRDYYTRGLDSLSHELIFPSEKTYARSVFWMYGLVLKRAHLRDTLMAYLEKNGVETRTFFFPMHWQPLYRDKGRYPVADYLGTNGLYLPSSSHISKADKDKVITLIKKFFS